MQNTTELEGRTAKASDADANLPVTLINKFVVPPERDDAFVALWTEASTYFRARPGFVSLRLHRAVAPDAEYRFVNVASWATLEDFRAAHDTDECRALIGQEAWREFPSNPTLYEVLITADHGNAEMMADPSTHQAHTAHTLNVVPLLYIGRKGARIASGGALQDVAPTLLAMMGLPQPPEMTGHSLLAFA